jgi:hypothetical protein
MMASLPASVQWAWALVFGLLFVGELKAENRVQVYPASEGEPLSKDFTVMVDQKSVPVYLARVVAMSPEDRQKTDVPFVPLTDTAEASFASFDLEGSAEVTVICSGLVQSAKILPTARGITPTVSGNRITFTVSHPDQLTLEINGDWVRSLHLFVDPWETNAPNPDDPNVLYFGPGVHYTTTVKVGSGKTVYVAGGAVVYGKLDAEHTGGPVFLLAGSNITLRGRGIIDGSLIPKPSPGGNIVGVYGQKIEIEGVTLRDSGSWTIPVSGCDDVKVHNVKIFGWRGNSDGIDIGNSRQVEVSDSFLRTYDDLVVVKTQNPKAGPARDITVKHCVLWNELAHSLSLGAELRAPVENVLFTDCDIIHDKGREWDLRVYNCDSGAVKNITFDNIRIEEGRRLFSLWIGQAVWSKEAERGHIDDVTFRNITAPKPERDGPVAELKGFDATHMIDGVTFEQVVVDGHPLQARDVSQNGFVQQVSIKP